MSSPLTFDVALAQRKKVLAELGAFGLDLAPVGQTSAVSLLYITNSSQKDISSAARDALEAATGGLGYLKSEYGVLSLADLQQALQRSGSALTLKQATEHYIEILDPHALIFLEAMALQRTDIDIEFVSLPIKDQRERAKRGMWHGRTVAVATDFFASFSDPEFKKIAWAQMVPASRQPIF